MVQGKKQLNSKPKFADVVNTFRLYNRKYVFFISD